MKQEPNNEIDLLLRRLSRRQDFVTPGGLPDNGDHLDADELSSYAENVLPAVARTRYTEHLADCARCRKLVAQLTASAGLMSAPASTKAEPSAIRKFLASLFSPIVLRYAAPALGLIVVTVIGFVVLRQGELENKVARVNPNSAPAHSASPVPTNDSSLAEDNSGPSDPKSSAIAPETQPGRVKTTQSRDTDDAAPVADASGAKAGKPVPNTESQTDASPTVASAPAERREVDEFSKRTDDQVKKDAGTRPAAPPAGSEAASSFETAKTQEQRAAPAPATGQTKAMESRAMRSRAPLQVGEPDSAATETRSVGGRRFRKSGSVWIDTAYDSSRTTINLTRGSEQYRALVADEPGIKAIAEQLGGEIIVVWKGRSYRIR